MKKYQQGVAWVMVVAIVAILILLGGVYLYFNQDPALAPSVTEDSLPADDDNDQAIVPAVPADGSATVCTMDAKQCSDGSYVGRSGPNCEFVCPGDDFGYKE